MQASDGNFYGTTSYGGTNTIPAGTVFRIGANGTFTNLYYFTGGGADGSNPEAGLVQGNDGILYGTTYGGNNDPYGNVSEISTNRGKNNLYTFTGGADGAKPFAGLVLGSDGNFYGTTTSGGTYTNGAVFRIGTNGTFHEPVFLHRRH